MTVLIEIGKFITGGLVIGYFVSPRPISLSTASWGAVFALACFTLAVLVFKAQWAMDVMGYIFMVGTIIVLAVGGWVLYQDHKTADGKTSDRTK